MQSSQNRRRSVSRDPPPRRARLSPDDPGGRPRRRRSRSRPKDDPSYNSRRRSRSRSREPRPRDNGSAERPPKEASPPLIHPSRLAQIAHPREPYQKPRAPAQERPKDRSRERRDRSVERRREHSKDRRSERDRPREPRRERSEDREHKRGRHRSRSRDRARKDRSQDRHSRRSASPLPYRPSKRRSRSRSPRRQRHHSRSRSPKRRRQSPSHKGYSPPRSRKPLPDQEISFRGLDNSDQPPTKYGGAPKEMQKPNFKTTGLLAKEANLVAGTKISLKYHEPPEARKPSASSPWRLFVFKGEDMLETIELHTRSCWLLGKAEQVVDIALGHPSSSQQHAVIQFRHIQKTVEDELGIQQKKGKVKPYIIDLDSTNGTELNGKPVEASRYVELRDKDILTFGGSEREYVIMLPPKEA